ncbi:hypothetical protein A1O3_10491 [Capronia epimyces CBS 606.96]|uniref:Uncharacterized protein n=1 Tax=Capronia epimyces CBS 606.96 TaxID=1182542 RepID=W9XIT5_9EURO|nr:uncharacterized protein A1O3_10491 [Capronia epimyces CBS 606.96]EXJ76846.1 hypothetical protein A1O3_10491 [Capronia epimyces CBS 606.96]
MEVTSASFSEQAIHIIQQIADSRFIALDLEFSGVAGRRPAGGSGKLSLQEYYQDLRAAAQIYQVLQVGLTIVTEDIEKGQYVARPYNFDLCPLPATKEQVFRRVWSYNSGAISFLIRNGFNIDRPILLGVHYLSRQEEQQVRKKLIEDDQARRNIPDMVLKEDDSVLVEHIRQSIRDWQATPKEKQEPYVNVPAERAPEPVPLVLNRYQVRLTHQIVRNEYPKLKTQGMGHFVQITNPTAEQQADEKEMREQFHEREVLNAIGFRWIIEAIAGGDISRMPHFYVQAAYPEGEAPGNIQGFLDNVQSRLRSHKRALVGHNCLTDLVNLYRCFIGDLPDRVEDFSTRLKELFPILMDTKYIAGLGNKSWADTSLRAVESDLFSVDVPRIVLPPKFDRYLHAANYHEAGFDSYVTAKIGLKIPGKLKRERKDIKALVEASAPASTEDPRPAVEKTQYDIGTGGVPEGQDQKVGITKTIVEAIKAPATMVKSILTSSESSTRKASIIPVQNPSSTDETTSRSQNTVQLPRVGIKKLKTISQKSNIFDMLEDDASGDEAQDDSQRQIEQEQQRIAQMVEEGRLLPRWEDTEFWKLVSNKLQANACQEGILDLSRRN